MSKMNSRNGWWAWYACCYVVWTGTVRCHECIEEYRSITLPILSKEKPRQRLNLIVDGRGVRLSLREVDDVFTKDLKVKMIRGNVTIELDYEKFAETHEIPRAVYSGTVAGKPASWAYGAVTGDGLFDGSFAFDNLTYHLEPLSRYFSETSDDDGLRNAILYRSVDVAPCGTDHRRTRDGRATRLQRRRRSLSQTDAEAAALAIAEPSEFMRICKMRMVADFRFHRNCYPDQLHLLWNSLRDADAALRHQVLHKVGGIGFRITEFLVYREVMRAHLQDTTYWDPVKYFQELALYPFGDVCAGFLLTYRQMEPTSEVYGPSLYQSSPASFEHGACTTLEPRVPPGALDDYGEYLTNVLPINFMYHRDKVKAEHITGQAIHQFLHFVGVKEDGSKSDYKCNLPVNKSVYVYADSFPVLPIPSLSLARVTSCAMQDIVSFVRGFGRPCFNPCEPNSEKCDWKGAEHSGIVAATSTTTRTTTAFTGTRDWTEVCFLYPIDAACPLEATVWLIPLLVALVVVVRHRL